MLNGIRKRKETIRWRKEEGGEAGEVSGKEKYEK